MRALLFALLLPACLPQMQDNSLESHSLTDGFDEVNLDEAGALQVTAGAEEGDWTLQVGEQSLALHSPSRVDLSALDGDEVTLYAQETWGGGPNVVISDEAGVVYLVTGVVGFDGTDAFGEARWRFGEPIGHGEIINKYDEHNRVTYMEAVIADDSGDVVALPGEPLAVHFDGVQYRLTVIAAYQPYTDPRMACGPSDMLSIELVRVDDVDDTPLSRQGHFLAARAGCG